MKSNNEIKMSEMFYYLLRTDGLTVDSWGPVMNLFWNCVNSKTPFNEEFLREFWEILPLKYPKGIVFDYNSLSKDFRREFGV